jgi:pyridinium-3,5-biscarboxylic acid mononucleotide sulfurtransferase
MGERRPSLEPRLEDKLARLTESIAPLPSLLVAFSGGADSAFLLAAATRTLGPGAVVAATAVSPSLPETELEDAADFAAGLGVRHVTPGTNELDRPGYAANARDRCFHCKAELLDVLVPYARSLSLAAVATGTNADDVRDRFRPGIRAAAARGALTPLSDAGLTKADVRAVSAAWGLTTADKPAAACLSSRVAFGIGITRDRLARIERAEDALRTAMHDAGLPVRNLRVRDLGDRARVEVDAELVASLSDRPDVLAAVRGFGRVTVDERGFRSGSMNEVPTHPAPDAR